CLLGPTSQAMIPDASNDRQALTQRWKIGTWQHDATAALGRCLGTLDVQADPTPAKVSLRGWVSTFATLRNKTRGHGAMSSGTCSRLCPDVETSLRLVTNHTPTLARQCAYLHRNLSGKY